MLTLRGAALTLEDLAAIGWERRPVALAEEARTRLRAARAALEGLLASGAAVYGVNTGFGKLADVRVAPSELSALQTNLVRSHACGVGPALSEAEVRCMLALRANALAVGASGVRPVVVEKLLELLRADVVPLVPEKGSVGASGDLAPLAHLALVLIGEGEAYVAGARLPGAAALERAGLAPLRLESKEGLALLNGTQAMLAVGGLALARAERLAQLADVAGAMSLEALRGTPVAFDARIQALRPHPGQAAAAAHLRELLEDSEIRRSHLKNDPRVQDAYSLRCMPQVHGAVRDVLRHGRETAEIETGSATDNPLLCAGDSLEVVSGGNFHGAPLAFAYDAAAIALVSLSSMVERRIDRLVNPDLNEGLPPFLTAHAGVASGFMIAQVSAAAVLNESRILAHPASADNTPTSGGKEDHVSMGMTAALKLRQIADNLESLLAIELLAAAEGLEYRLPLRPGRGVRRAHEIVRAHAARLAADRPLAPDIAALAAAIRAQAFAGL
ncbi:MAG: histidine ammonia-lyase [Terriglobales bacterium]